MPRRDLAAPTASLSLPAPELNPTPGHGLLQHQPLPAWPGHASHSPSGRSSPQPATRPQVNERRNEPSADGARTPPNSSGIAPRRSRPMSPMLSVPPIIPATRHGTFRYVFTPHLRPIRRCSSTRSPRTGALSRGHHRHQSSPRHQIRLSNDAWIFARPCNNRTLRGALSARNVEASGTPIVPVQRAPFAATATVAARSAWPRSPRSATGTARADTRRGRHRQAADLGTEPGGKVTAGRAGWGPVSSCVTVILAGRYQQDEPIACGWWR
jgi:hypothetical protein